MSENQDFSAYRAEESNNQAFDPMAVLPANEGKTHTGSGYGVKDFSDSLDGQSYFLGEVPQVRLVDPQAFLPLNSDKLVGSVNMIEKLLADIGILIEAEVSQIQKIQRKINLWEERIEKNKALIQKNLNQIKQNTVDALYDKKNRDYWLGRAEDVTRDYSHAEMSGRQPDWAWLIKKYGLKNADGTEIDSKNSCVEELCNGEASNLAGEYRATSNKYEAARKDKETENCRMVHENANFLNVNDQLQGHIAAAYANEIEPLQDGVLLFKELGVKLKALGQEGDKATYGDLRDWSEIFLNEFIKTNSKVHLSVVTDFRKLTSIPLPAHNC